MPPSRPVPPTDSRTGSPSRRTLLATAAAFGLVPDGARAQAPGATPAVPATVPPPVQPDPAALPAAPGTARFRPEPAPETPVWCFDGKALPPVIRVKLGQAVRLKVENRTDKPL